MVKIIKETENFEGNYEESIETTLHGLLLNSDDFDEVNTFEEEGVLTKNRGLVLHVDGKIFQLSIVRAR